MNNFNDLLSLFKDRRVLYITTKNLDYIRVTQEINILRECAKCVTVIGSISNSYPVRLLHVYKALISLSLEAIDVVFVGFSPQLVLPFFGAKLHKRPMVIDCFISVYDTMVMDRQKFRDGGIISGFCHRLDAHALAGADYVVCDTMAHGNYFSDEFDISPDKMYVLYLQADIDIYNPALYDSSSNDHDNNVHRVLYFGSILNLQGVDIILNAIGQFSDRDDYRFEIIGPVSERMNRPDSYNITYIPWLSQSELAAHIAGADLCLAGHFAGDIMKARRTIPGKAYIYEAMGKPMILGDGEANHELFTEDGRHIFVPMGDADALAAGIKSYFE